MDASLNLEGGIHFIPSAPLIQEAAFNFCRNSHLLERFSGRNLRSILYFFFCCPRFVLIPVL